MTMQRPSSALWFECKLHWTRCAGLLTILCILLSMLPVASLQSLPRHACMQEVSSVTGNVLDTWELIKPVGWQPLGASTRKAFVQSFNIPYNSDNVIELFGLAYTNYTIVEEPVYPALLAANLSLTEHLQSMSEIVTAAVNGAAPGGLTPDTMPDIWATLEPVYNLIQEYSAINSTVAAAARPGLVPMLQQVQKVADAWATQDGLWHLSQRAQSAQPPTIQAGSSTADLASVAGR